MLGLYRNNGKFARYFGFAINFSAYSYLFPLNISHFTFRREMLNDSGPKEKIWAR